MHHSAALYLLVTCVTDEPQLRDEQMWFGCDQRHRLQALNALELNVEGTLICWERSSSYCSDVTVDPCQCFANPVRLSHARASFTVRSQRVRGETLRSRAAHRLHSLARNQSRVRGPNNGTWRSRNGAIDMQHDIKNKGRILLYYQSFVRCKKHAIWMFGLCMCMHCSVSGLMGILCWKLHVDTCWTV